MQALDAEKPRILVIDDNPAIHEDFRKIFNPISPLRAALSKMEAALFDDAVEQTPLPAFEIDGASQGDEGVAMISRAAKENRPYAMAFIDVRMPPGRDGIETAELAWKEDPNLQIVLCTAFSDYSWSQIRRRLGPSDALVILKKPFDNIEVLQLADALSRKWKSSRQAQERLALLERTINDRNRELQASKARLKAVNRHFASGPHATLTTQAMNRLVLADRIKDGLDHGQFCLYYQPLIDIATSKIVSFEALLRWENPRDGFISPAEFIPVAEDSGLINSLGAYVLDTACKQLMHWRSEGVQVVPVAVNISAVQLETQNVVEVVRRTLADSGLPPQMLTLEITESALMKNASSHVQDLQSLRQSGVRIAIDDFGTGYSSLAYLKHLPVDTLKVDRSFIKHVDTVPADEAIVGAILSMAHHLGLKVVAEGVETAGQLEVLRRHGCETAQGFFFSRPLPAGDCLHLQRDLALRPSFTETIRMKAASGNYKL
jgi:EAL domain-containing protein (putative c-di-GMP-specific phosphodiesterase class I)/DNA-binding LytR/AlgR family response regulator